MKDVEGRPRAVTTCPRCGETLSTLAALPRGDRRSRWYRHVLDRHAGLSPRERSLLVDAIVDAAFPMEPR